MSTVTFGLAALISAMGAEAMRAQVPTIEDAIRMVRIQMSVAQDGSVAAFSPDGEKFATIVWHGDLQRNLNIYTLLLFNVRGTMSGTSPRTLLTREFIGDPHDQHASPITGLAFQSDNRTLAFLGRDGDRPAQVYSVDIVTKRITQLTHHPMPVRSFVLGPDGTMRAYSAVAEADDAIARQERLSGDGVFLWDRSVFDQRSTTARAFTIAQAAPRWVRQYFLAAEPQPKLIFDSRQSRAATPLDLDDPEVKRAPPLELHEEVAIGGWSSLTADSRGKHALLFPYALAEHPMTADRYAHYKSMNAYGRRVAAPYGLVDLETGRIERLIDAPHPQFDSRNGGGEPLWAQDGRSVIVYTLLPLDVEGAAETPPQWVEVDIVTRALSPLHVPPGWRVLRWDSAGKALVLSKDNVFASFTRRDDGRWGELTEIGAASGFNSWFDVATNGRVVVGVKEALRAPPEIAAFDLASKETKILTNLNPSLHLRRYGAVEAFHWKHRFEPNASGFLIKPIEYVRGKRYPLVVLLDDSTLHREVEEPFLLDAVLQLSGHAIQMLAGHGFVVLYLREPLSLRTVMSTAQEGEYMLEHIESAITELDRAGLIDPWRVGLSGWSRAGYYVDYALIHGSTDFSAATQIDGGALEYFDGMRQFKDTELQRIRTPLLFEPHGLPSLVLLTAMADRLDAWGKVTEVLYFPTASHNATRPQHRLRSLGTHIDWWRFWLQDYEDPDPAKAGQYQRWRELRKLQKAQEAERVNTGKESSQLH